MAWWNSTYNYTEANTTTTDINTTSTTKLFRYELIFVRESSSIKNLFVIIYLLSNTISATCFLLLIRFYLSKKYHKVHEKNLHSTCVCLLTINILKTVNFAYKNAHLNDALIYANAVSSFLLFTTGVDLYLTLRSIIRDVFVEEALSRRRFAAYLISSCVLPAVALRLFDYFQCDQISASIKLHCSLNFITVILIFTALRTYYYSTYCEMTEGYKYYSNEKYTSTIVCALSSIRFVLHLTFLISSKYVTLSILDFFRAYEGMYIYYHLVVERRKKWLQQPS